MKNEFLRQLNFETLLGYPKDFRPQHKYDAELPCKRFCVACEKSGTLDKSHGKLTLMSHGCDSDDFERVLRSRLNRPAAITEPILFLLEDPGGDYSDIREPILFEGIEKKIPVTHYYFAPSTQSWPQTIEEVIEDGNRYGSYFAYIMWKYSLSNVYITNLVKCKREGVQNRSLVEEHCVSVFLEKELSAFLPRLIFCFGRRTFNALCYRFPELTERAHYMYHPATRRSLSRIASDNDERIQNALNQLITVRLAKMEG